MPLTDAVAHRFVGSMVQAMHNSTNVLAGITTKPMTEPERDAAVIAELMVVVAFFVGLTANIAATEVEKRSVRHSLAFMNDVLHTQEKVRAGLIAVHVGSNTPTE